MRKIYKIIAILLTITIGRLFGQSSYSCSNINKSSLNKNYLDSTYKSIDSVYDPESKNRRSGVYVYSSMSKEHRLVSDEHSNFKDNVDRQLLKVGLILNKISWVEIEVYINKEGKVDYFVSNFPKTEVSDLWLQPVKDTLCNWAMSYQSTLSGKEPFKMYLQFNLKDRLYISVKSQSKKRSDGYIDRYNTFITTTRPDTVDHIRLNRVHLTRVPGKIKQFKNLRILDLSDNEIEILPKFVSKLKKIDTLILLGNELAPKKIKFKRNTHIKYINIQYNKLSTLPKSLSKNKSLTSLWLGHNDLKNGIESGFFKRFRLLEDVNLYSAGLTKIPSSIGYLSSLKKLDLYYNNLTRLPKEFFEIKSLQKLGLSYNDFGNLPNEIGQMNNLQELYVQGNSLTNLPASLVNLKKIQTIDISDNAFEYLPELLTKILSINYLNISKNNLKIIPEKLLDLPSLKRLNATKINSDKVSDPKNIILVKKLREKQVEVFFDDDNELNLK